MELIFTCEIVTFPVLCSLDDLPGAGAGASVGVGVGDVADPTEANGRPGPEEDTGALIRC